MDSIFGAIHSDDRAQILNRVNEARQNGGKIDFEARMLREDGSEIRCRGECRPEADGDGKNTFVFGSLREIGSPEDRPAT